MWSKQQNEADIQEEMGYSRVMKNKHTNKGRLRNFQYRKLNKIWNKSTYQYKYSRQSSDDNKWNSILIVK
jgi:hypothetical protein